MYRPIVSFLMIDYKIFVNNGNEAFGTTGKTLSIEEQPRTISEDFLAEEMHHANELIPKRTIKEVLSIFSEVSARLMAEGFAIQFQKDGKVSLRLYADAKIKGGNINLSRAKELDPTVTEITTANASALVQKAGVQIRAYAEVEQKLTELLLSFNPSPHLTDIVERAYVEKKDSNGGSSSDDGSQQDGGSDNNDDQQGDNDDQQGGGELEP